MSLTTTLSFPLPAGLIVLEVTPTIVKASCVNFHSHADVNAHGHTAFVREPDGTYDVLESSWRQNGNDRKLQQKRIDPINGLIAFALTNYLGEKLSEAHDAAFMENADQAILDAEENLTQAVSRLGRAEKAVEDAQAEVKRVRKLKASLQIQQDSDVPAAWADEFIFAPEESESVTA